MRLGGWARLGQLTYCLSGCVRSPCTCVPLPGTAAWLLLQQAGPLPPVSVSRPSSARLTRPKLVSDKHPFVFGYYSVTLTLMATVH